MPLFDQSSKRGRIRSLTLTVDEKLEPSNIPAAEKALNENLDKEL